MQEVLDITQPEIIKCVGIIKELRKETDRAAVILGTSNLDALLYNILHKYLLPCAVTQDALLDSEMPLSSFSARINIIFRLGLIDAECSQSLHLIRKIRNDFAHEVSSGTLDSEPHRNRIKNLTARFIHFPPYQAAKNVVFQGKELTPGDEFRIVVSILPVYLTIILNTIIPIAPVGIPLSILSNNIRVKP